MTLQSIRYDSSVQKGAACCVVYTDAAGEAIPAQALDALIHQTSEDILILVDGPAVYMDFVEQSVQTIAKSKAIGFVYYEPSPCLCFRKSNRPPGMSGDGNSLSSFMRAFIESADVEKRSTGILILQPLYGEPEKTAVAELLMDRPISFSTVGATFRAAASSPLTANLTSPGWTEQQLVARIQSAIELLNQNRNSEALPALIEINQQFTIPELFFVQAIAEVRLQQYRDAGKSLLLLLENDPSHMEGQKLMNELRSSFLS